MKKTPMASVAALALMATTGFALAQGAGMSGSKGGDAPAASAPRAAESPSSSMPAAKGPANDSRTTTDPKSASDSRPSSDTKAASEQKNPAGARPATTAQDKPGVAPDKSGTAAQERTDTKGTKSATDTKATTDTKTGDTRTGDAKTGDAKTGSGSTTGNAATSANAAPPTEKRTQITSAIRQEKVEEVRNVNFNISVGVAVPSTVRVHPVPTRVIEIYPEWRGYDFILVNGRYVILRPQTHEIVYIIEG
jgi:hypothetical protein